MTCQIHAPTSFRRGARAEVSLHYVFPPSASGPLGSCSPSEQNNIMANYDNSRERIKFDFGLNLGFMVFTIYLSDLVYWVGFVTGIKFTTQL